MEGIIAYQGIKELIDKGIIKADKPIEDLQIQPSSVDLRLGKYGYRVPASFLLPTGGSVQEKLDEYAKDYYKFSIENGAFLEARKTYVFELQEELNLPEDMKARCNPKSSTGRVDTFTRLITDDCTNFDNVARGYNGKLYLKVFPMSFDLKVKQGLSLNQIRFFQGKNYKLNTEELTEAYKKYQLLFDKEGNPIPLEKASVEEGGLFLTLDLSDDIVGYRSKRNAPPIDLTKVKHHKMEDYWEPIHKPTSGKLILDPEHFYILKSKERIRIPTDFAVEMVDFHSGIGEFRSHYAGFFDPGFGYGKEGEVNGTPAVLEVRMRDLPMEVVDKQIFVKMVFEKMTEKPEVSYGVELQSNYHKQKLALSKHFV